MAQITKTTERLNDLEIVGGQIVGSTPATRASSGASNNGFTAEGLRVFFYDASAPSGSRFTEITDFTTEFFTPTDAGDRIYFGAPQNIKTWSVRAIPTIGKSPEKYIAKYYSILANDLVEVSWMSMNDQCIDQNDKDLWRISNEQYFTLNKNIDADWLARKGILDKIPDSGEFRYWSILEVPVGGIATPAKIKDVTYRSNGVSQLECNSQSVFWGNARVKVSDEIPAINFWDGGIPVTASLPITSTLIQTVHKLRNAANDAIHAPWSIPFGVDTSTPMEIYLSFSSSAAITTADIQLDLKAVSRTGGIIGAGESSDRIVTRNITTSGINANESILLIDDYDISNLLEGDLIFIQITRTDNNGGDFFPLDFFLNPTLYKIGKF